VNLGLMATGFFVVLTILAVAGLLAWDYVDQAMAKNNEDDMLPAAPQPEATTTS
jgi:predicted negative regulator of RcsB-dependent stress response